MRSVVTGASGFIGRHLVAKLKDEGHEVIIIPHEKLQAREYLRGFLEEIKPDYIFHLAAYGNMSNQTEEDEMYKANVLGTYNLLQATKDIDYKVFFNFSSSSVYGWVHGPMKEFLTLRPNTFYAATKASAEHFCRYFRKKYKKIIINLRLFSVYGEGEADFRFIPTLIRNKIQGKTSQVIKGNHDWIHVDDVIRAVFKIMEQGDELPHRTFNIGTGVMTSNQELASMITDDFDFEPKGKQSDSIVWVADNYRLKELNWKPEIGLEDGLKRTYAYYQRQYSDKKDA